MIGRVRLAGPGMLGTLSAIWLLALLGVDVAFNPHLWTPEAASAPLQPEERALAIHLNRLCCTACFADARKALQGVPWLAGSEPRPRTALASIEEATGRLRSASYAGWLDVPLRDPGRVDVVELERALRQEGLVASEVVVRGLSHLRLAAEFRHACCGSCRGSLDRLAPAGSSAEPGLGSGSGGVAPLHWIDRVDVQDGQRRVLVYPRDQDPEVGIDVAELLAAFRQLGLTPSALRVEPEPTTTGS